MSAPWLGELPPGWQEISLRYLARVETGSRDTVDAVPGGDYPFIIRSQKPLEIDTYSYDTEAVLTAGDGAVGEIFHHVDGRFEVHQRVYVMHDFRGMHGRFFFYYFSSEFGQTVAYGGAQSTVASLRRPMFTGFPVAVPPLDVQRAIAGYLDRETAQIDAFIAKNEELIALLTERRATVIDRGVFGLRDESESVERRVPDFVEELAALRDFVRRTPIDWRIARFKSVTWRRVIRNVDGSAPMRSLKTTGEVVRRTSQQSPDDSSVPRYLLVEPGDLVVNPMWLVGGAIGVSTRHGAVSPDYRVFRPRMEVAPRFLHHLLRSRPYRAQYELFTRAETTFDRRVNQPDLDRLSIPIPPLEEQMGIATAIDRELDRIDDTIEVAKRSIGFARERRAALISAAVTGKIDVGVVA